MARRRAEPQWCPLGCGRDIIEMVEHHCMGEMMATDHAHRFGDDGECVHPGCGLDVQDAVRMAGEGALAEDIPAASTVCSKCDAPITDEERRSSGLCNDCLAASAREQDRPAYVANADAIKVCGACGAMFETATDLDLHARQDHPAEPRTAQLRRQQSARLEAERIAGLVRVEQALEVCVLDAQHLNAVMREELERRGIPA